MLKKILIALGVLVVLAGGLIWFVFDKTSGMSDAADTFFGHLKAGKFAEARAMTSSQFQKATSAEDLGGFSKQFGFEKYKEASYSSRGFENGVGYLEGNIDLTDGSKLPVRIEFIDENGWKIQLVTPKAGIGAENTMTKERQSVPSDGEVTQLVQLAMAQLGDAIAARDFSNFYAYISNMWRGQTTKEELLKAFGVFIEKEIDLRATRDADMVLTGKPQIDLQNTLNVDAEWATKPVRTIGNFRFVKEGAEWRLIGVSVNTKE
jgi:hypothetical protein